MRLSEIQIQNFRAFKDEKIQFDDYTCFVGPNGCGKSTVLTALNVFFRNNANAVTDLVNLTDEDFHQRDTNQPVKITVIFDDLQPDAETDFAHYVRQGRLIVSAVADWDATSRMATVRQFGERLGMRDFIPFFEAQNAGKPVSELKTMYAEVQKRFSELSNASTKQSMVDALHDFEENHADECVPIPSEDQFYGISKGKNLLQKYIQWVFVPAVKEPSNEQLESKKNPLGALLERTVRSKLSFEQPLKELRNKTEELYLNILNDNRGALKTLSDSLTLRLQEWAHPDSRLELRWNDDTSKAISISEPIGKILAGEGPFEGELARFGHGLQRSFLLALLQELAAIDEKTGPMLLFACEEPELYQHPPQARHLASVLERLSAHNAQIIVSTHSPYFVSGKGFESVRMFRKPAGASEAHVRQHKFADLSASLAEAKGDKPITLAGLALKVDQALNVSVNDMFFTKVLVLVEGLEDVAYISTYLTLMDKWEAFRRSGCHIVPADRKSRLIQPLAIAKGLEIPTFVVFDADGHATDTSGSRKCHEKDNITILKLLGVSNPVPFPESPLWNENAVMWDSEIGKVVKDDLSEEVWNKLGESVRNKYNLSTVGGLEKNSAFIGYLLTEGWEANLRSNNLSKACDLILAFAGSAGSL